MQNIRPGVTLWLIGLAFFLAIPLSGCSSDDNDNNQALYSVTVTNLTNNQPLSPQAYIIHREGYTAWEPGQSASSGLELLAEAGDPDTLISEATFDIFVRAVQQSATPIPPGASATVQLQTWRFTDLRLTIATMLVNTNDSFTGTAGELVIGDMAAGESRNIYVQAWDAGTEANTETAASIPGPAANGEGFNSARDDTDFVYLHPGVVTADDGLTTSVLDESHRWDNPVAKITVSRIF